MKSIAQWDATFSPHFGADPEEFASGRTDVPAIKTNVAFVSTGQVFYLLEATDRAQVDALMQKASQTIADMPGLLAFASRGSIFAGNSGGTRSINVDISGPDLPGLFDASRAAFLKARTLFDRPQVRPDPSNLTLGQPMLEVLPNWERAAELGVDTANLGYTIWLIPMVPLSTSSFSTTTKSICSSTATKGRCLTPPTSAT